MQLLTLTQLLWPKGGTFRECLDCVSRAIYTRNRFLCRWRVEAEHAPTVPELLDRLAEFYDRDRDLIQALEAPRSSFYRWKFKGHRRNPQARAKIYQLAVHHGLVAAAPPTLRPEIAAGPMPETRIRDYGLGRETLFWHRRCSIDRRSCCGPDPRHSKDAGKPTRSP